MDDISKPLEGFCLALTDYAVAPRYPGCENLVGEADIDRVLESARLILDYVLIRPKLTSPPDLSGFGWRPRHSVAWHWWFIGFMLQRNRATLSANCTSAMQIRSAPAGLLIGTRSEQRC